MVYNFAYFIALLFFSVAVSQPLFYWIALTGASRQLSAPAYIELRNRIDDQMRSRGPAMYYGALAACLLLAGLSFTQDNPVLRAASFIALLCLVTDVALMMKGNVPINNVIQKWTPVSHPTDWQDYRDRWLKIFGYRQLALCIGFVSLLAGAVFK